MLSETSFSLHLVHAGAPQWDVAEPCQGLLLYPCSLGSGISLQNFTPFFCTERRMTYPNTFQSSPVLRLLFHPTCVKSDRLPTQHF